MSKRLHTQSILSEKKRKKKEKKKGKKKSCQKVSPNSPFERTPKINKVQSQILGLYVTLEGNWRQFTFCFEELTYVYRNSCERCSIRQNRASSVCRQCCRPFSSLCCVTSLLFANNVPLQAFSLQMMLCFITSSLFAGAVSLGKLSVYR